MGHSEKPSLPTSRCGPTTGEGGRTVVWIAGEHDVATRGSLTAAIALAQERGTADVLLDLSGVTFMDASTVGAIVEGANRLAASGQRLGVRAPSPLALLVLELCGVAHLVDRGPARRRAERAPAGVDVRGVLVTAGADRGGT